MLRVFNSKNEFLPLSVFESFFVFPLFIPDASSRSITITIIIIIIRSSVAILARSISSTMGSVRSPFARKDSSPNLRWIYIYDEMRHRDLAP